MTTLLALQSHYLTGRRRLKSSSKCLLIDLDTPLSPREESSLLFSSLKFPILVRPPNTRLLLLEFLSRPEPLETVCIL